MKMPRTAKKSKMIFGDQAQFEADNKCFRYNKECLELKCDWHDCQQIYPDMLTLVCHLGLHLGLHHATEDLICRWKDCGYLAVCKRDFTIHVNYHAFHTKLKCIGANIITRKNLSSCTLDGRDRNLLPELPENLACTWGDCKGMFDNPESYYRHVSKHADDVWESNVRCQWTGCKSQFNANYRLREHLRSHSQERMIACPNCGRLFSNRTKFQDHLKRQIPSEEQKYRCSHCSKMLASERLLRDHMRNHINHYKCPSCDMTCSNPSNLRKHIKYRHSDERPHSCDFCEYKCKSQNDLCRHLMSHVEAPQNECPHKGCGFTSRSDGVFRQHLRTKHGEPELSKSGVYVCHLCTKKFQRGSYLTRHLMNKHGFRWPSGHCRFTYKQNDDGSRKLQTVRYESIELTQEMIDRDMENLVEIDIDDADIVEDMDIVEHEAGESSGISRSDEDAEQFQPVAGNLDCAKAVASAEAATEAPAPAEGDEKVLMLIITGLDGVARNIQLVTN